jgi:hypothetical protein
MVAIKSAAEIAEIVAKIEAELNDLDWLATGDQPCAFNVEATGSLPNGWVKLASDSGEVFGDSERVLEALKSENGNGEFGECFATLDFTDKPPGSSRDWPADLIEFEQLEDGTANDNPITLVTVGTNAGLRFAVGPHGVSECALGNWMDSGQELAETRGSALTSV